MVKLAASTQPTQSSDPTRNNINRWGDFGAVAIDPVDSSFWVTQEFVNSPIANTWQTFWAQIAACRWPVIDFQPQPQMVAPCSANAVFSLGVRPVSIDLSSFQGIVGEVDNYVWTQNSNPVVLSARFLVSSNLTAGSGGQLTILNPGYADEGFYRAEVINACGEKYASYSEPAPLLLQSVPSFMTLNTGVRPPLHYDHLMVFDQARGQCMFFGGEYVVNGGLQYANDTWLWDGTTWTAAAPSVSPSARTSYGMVYDSDRQRVVLFGGYYYDGVSASGSPLGDTWEWDGTNWQLKAAASTNTPPPRTRLSMAYDSVRHETILIGSDSPNYQDHITTWAWNGTNWTIRATNLVSRLISSYLGNYDVGGNAMAFDERRGVVVLFGPFGSSANLVLEWDGEQWTAKNPVSVTPANSPNYPGVVDSVGYQAFYDPYRGMVACVGGGIASAIWYWDGQNFYGFDTLVDGAPAVVPRIAGGIAFDRQRRALVWSGGDLAQSAQSPHETREIRFVDNVTFVQQPGPVAVPTGQTVHLHAAVTGGGPLQYTWVHDTHPVANDTRVTGANTADLTITPAAAADSGSYQLQVTGPCGPVSSDLVRVSVGPLLNLTQQTASAYRISWSATNGVVQEALTVLGPWTNRPDFTTPFDMPVQKTGSRFYRLTVPAQ